jgi:hypothetical protein
MSETKWIVSPDDALFIPDDYYIQLLRELNSMSLKKTTNKAYHAVRENLKQIERTMSASDIIRNTKLAFKN